MFIKLVSTKGSNTRFDAASAQSNEEETHHGQNSACEDIQVQSEVKKNILSLP